MGLLSRISTKVGVKINKVNVRVSYSNWNLSEPALSCRNLPGPLPHLRDAFPDFTYNCGFQQHSLVACSFNRNLNMRNVIKNAVYLLTEAPGFYLYNFSPSFY